MVATTLDNTIGAAFMGMVFSAIMYGATNIQTFMYYSTYYNDRLVHKYAVAALWILDTIHLSLTIAATYHYLITNFGVVAELTVVNWAYKLQIAINIVIIFVVQTLYAARVWRLGRRNNPIPPIIVFITLVGGYGCHLLVMGILLVIKTYSVNHFDKLSDVSWVIYGSFISATVVDFVIAGVMCSYLMKSKSGFSSTNSKIMMIVRMTLITGCLTSAVSLLCLICYAVMPNNLIFLGIEFLLTKVYINSFLAMLNARQSGRDNGDSTGQSISIGKFNVRTTASHVATVNDSSLPLSPLSVHGARVIKSDDPSDIYPIMDYKNDDFPPTPSTPRNKNGSRV